MENICRKILIGSGLIAVTFVIGYFVGPNFNALKDTRTATTEDGVTVQYELTVKYEWGTSISYQKKIFDVLNNAFVSQVSEIKYGSEDYNVLWGGSNFEINPGPEWATVPIKKSYVKLLLARP